MPYINLTDNTYPHTEASIKAAHPQTSFPALFNPPECYAWVFPTPVPDYNPITQYYREIAPVLTSKGHWEQRWEITNLSAEQIASNESAAKEGRNVHIKYQIASLESSQGRALREAALGGNKARLQAIDDQIAALRSQLQ